jgi:PAS domain S-box-containing protein
MPSTRILVVEDTAVTALDIASRLASLDYAVEGPVPSGEEAVQRVSASQPDLVLMDIRLSGDMDGVEAAAEIRARYGTPVIYLTAYADDETLRRAKTTDPYGYVGKPIVWEELFSTIEVALDRHQMERRLRESEARYRDFVEGTYDLVARLDSDGRFSFVNRMAEEFLGLDPQECIGVPVLDFIHPEDRTRTSAAMSCWAQNRLARATLESRVRGRGGQVRDMLWSVSLHYDAAGKVAYQNVIARDITDRKRAEESLRRAHRRMEQLVERQTEDLVSANERIERQIRELLQRNRELALVNHAVQAFSSTLDLDQVLTTILDQVRHALEVGACSVWLLNADREELVGFQASGYRSEIVRGWRLPVGRGIAGWVAQTGESLIVADARKDDRHFKGIDREMDVELRSILSVPLKAKEGVIGVLQVLDEATDRFCTDDLRSLEPLAASAASAIENARLYEETEALKRAF